MIISYTSSSCFARSSDLVLRPDFTGNLNRVAGLSDAQGGAKGNTLGLRLRKVECQSKSSQTGGHDVNRSYAIRAQLKRVQLTKRILA